MAKLTTRGRSARILQSVKALKKASNELEAKRLGRVMAKDRLKRSKQKPVGLRDTFKVLFR